jgi:hypothetical protein
LVFRDAEHASYGVLDGTTKKVIFIMTVSKHDDSGVKELLGDHPFVFIENISSKAMEDYLMEKAVAHFNQAGYAPDAIVTDRVCHFFKK